MSKTTIINIGIWIAVFLVLWFAVLPFYKEVGPLKSSITDVKASIAVEKEEIELLELLEEQLSERSDQVDQLNLAIPTKRDVASPIAIFEYAASINGLALSSINVDDVDLNGSERVDSVSPALSVLDVDLKLTGTYGSFRDFVSSLEESFPLLEIANISFSSTKASSSEGEELNPFNPSMDFDVSLETYYKTDQ